MQKLIHNVASPDHIPQLTGANLRGIGTGGGFCARTGVLQEGNSSGQPGLCGERDELEDLPIDPLLIRR